jgi:hypothetical protein
MSALCYRSGTAILPLFLAVCFLASPVGQANAECILSGTGTGIPNPDDPALGAWKYCVDISWDTGVPYALSHADVILLLEDCMCVCEDFPFGSADTAGTSTGVANGGDSCTVYYSAEFNCYGDPSIPDLDVPIVKFEPYESDCEPAPLGTGSYCYYSDWPPAEITEPESLLALKAGQTFCYGDLTGVLPGCQCNVRMRAVAWGTVKVLFE